MRQVTVKPHTAILLGALIAIACGENEVSQTPAPGADGTATPASASATSGASTSGVGTTGATTTGAGTSTATSAGATTSGSGGTASMGDPIDVGSSTTGGGPASCSEAAAAFSVQAVAFDPGASPSDGANGFSAGGSAELPVAVAADGTVYVGLSSGGNAVVAGTGGLRLTIPGATLGGVAATSDGVGTLLFDPSEELWAQVKRFSTAGEELFSTDLFRSANLDDEGTKGEAGSSRLGYLSGSDELVAYFGHTQRYDDGVRHQGGYLATVNSSGEQALLNGWFGSHNLDQRLWTSADTGAVIGLGDAYPIGIFFSMLSDNPRPEVIYRLAAAGNGTANGQLGGIVELSSALVVPFITNLSVSPDIDAGEWPNIDDAVADQIRAAAGNGTDMGVLTLPKSGERSDGDAPTVWLTPEPASGARLERLKSARYGNGDLVLLIWAEASGGSRDATRSYFTMVIDGAGAVCQAKTPLDASLAPTAGDDIVRGPGGAIYWANAASGGVSIVTLTPG